MPEQKINKESIFLRAKKIVLDILTGDFDETMKFKRRAQAFLKVVMSSVNKFMSDEAFLRASSIGYTIIVSFVPTLVVILLIGSRFINPEEYFQLGKEFVRKNGIPLDLDPYINIIKELLKNAGAIGGVGLLVLLFSATSVLRNIEDSLNRIWRVKRKRPMIQKISGFLMVMIFGPAVMAVGISYAQWLIGQFASPNLKEIRIFNESVYVMGEKQVFLEKTLKDKKFREINIAKEIDFEAKNDQRIIDSDDKKLLTGKEQAEMAEKQGPTDKAFIKKSIYVDYARVKQKQFLITDTGLILYSRDGGKVWNITRFSRADRGILFNLTFTKIQMMTENSGIIIGGSGLILRTNDGGETWEPSYISEVDSTLRQIVRVKPGTYAILGDNATAFITEDYARSFRKWESVGRALDQKKTDLKGAAFSGNKGFICGDSGTMLYTADGGLTFSKVLMSKSFDFQDIAMSPDGIVLAVGEEGLIRHAEQGADGKYQWMPDKSPTQDNLNSISYDAKSGKFLAVGDHYQIISDVREGKIKGSFGFAVIQKSPFWRRLIAAMGNVILPFIVILILFILIYKVIPYTHVSLKAASIGAATTSIIWVIFLQAFMFYASSFSKGTFAIYGTLAAIPLTLLLIWISSLIMLFGAEIAFFVQYPQLARMNKEGLSDEATKRQLWYSINLLQILSKHFLTGKGPVKEEKLITMTMGDQEEFSYVVQRLKERRYIEQTTEEGWILAVHPKFIHIADVAEEFDPLDYTIPGFDEKNSFMRAMKKYFDIARRSRREVFENLTMSDLLIMSEKKVSDKR